MRNVAAYLIGALFGVGISLSGMANPAKVLNFFDVAGAWDPSLAFVMGGAVIVTFIGYRFVLRRPAPAFENQFSLPASKKIDASLIGGSALFGVGWGIAGFCPGGALPAVGVGNQMVWVFVATMIAGIVLTKTALKIFDKPSV